MYRAMPLLHQRLIAIIYSDWLQQQRDGGSAMDFERINPLTGGPASKARAMTKQDHKG
jgi:hypothetical protein